MPLKGIDISEYQRTTPDGVVTRTSDGKVIGSLNDISFITLRASIAGRADIRYAEHYANARKAGLVVMAYHYGYPALSVPVTAQVAKFLATAADADFLWLDQEEEGFSDAQAQQFVDLVRASGRTCGLYHSASGFGGVNSDGKWVADYRAASVAAGYPMKGDASGELPNWDFWQYRGSPLDLNYANPARPLASFLRRGYVAGSEHEALAARAAALDTRVAILTDTVAALDATLAEKAATISALTTDLQNTQTALAAAPAAERERIAVASGAAEADRIRSL